MADHGMGMAEALFGLDGFRVLEVTEGDVELTVRVETVVNVAACDGCGTRAESPVRVERTFRDLPCFGRPVRLEWRKRRWRCRVCAGMHRQDVDRDIGGDLSKNGVDPSGRGGRCVARWVPPTPTTSGSGSKRTGCAFSMVAQQS
jgi:transposase